jgi:hypothetical protein
MRQPMSPVWIGIVVGLGLAPAAAGPCTDQIAQLEQRVRQSAKNPTAGPTAPQTLAAQLQRQPTPQSVKQAEDSARANFDAIIARAKTQDESGDHASCAKAVEEARLVYEFR